MKKILFINGSNQIGGGELSLLSIAKSFKENSSVLSFDKGNFSTILEEEKIDSIVPKNTKKLLSIKRDSSFFSITSKIKYLILSIIEIRNTIKQYDIVYCNSKKAVFVGILASLFTHQKFIVHVRDIMNASSISTIQKIVYKLLINLKKPIIIANSNATKSALIQIGIRPEITVIYNGITPPIIKNKQNRKFIVAMFSRISPWKGQKYFIEAIKMLNHDKIEFWIVGDALFGEDVYKNEIVNLVNDYKLSNRIKFIGYVNNPLDYMQDIDVLILPSVSPEPFGRVVIEAMFLKKVVIATNMGGVTEIIENEKSGFLVDPKNLVNELVKDILKVFNDRRLYHTIAENGYIRAIDNFTEERMIKQIKQIVGDD